MADRISQLKMLLEQEPNDPFCLYSIAFEYTKAGDTENAIAYYDRAIEADPDYCYAYYHKARALKESGDVAAALEVLKIGLERATASGDNKAKSEITAYIDDLS